MQAGHVKRHTLIHLSSVKGICAQLKPLVKEVNTSGLLTHFHLLHPALPFLCGNLENGCGLD